MDCSVGMKRSNRMNVIAGNPTVIPQNFVAVAVGFEPTVRLPPHALSRRAPLAARTRHRERDYKCQSGDMSGPVAANVTVGVNWFSRRHLGAFAEALTQA